MNARLVIFTMDATIFRVRYRVVPDPFLSAQSLRGENALTVAASPSFLPPCGAPMGCGPSASDPRAARDDEPVTVTRDDVSKTRHARASSDNPTVPSAPSVSYQVRLRGGPLTQEAYNARLSGVNGCVEVEVPLGRGHGTYALRYAMCSQRGYYPEAPNKRN